ncbi:hypothetical protein H112_04300 [Trichophyton rubrum D6]|uniref:Ribonucleases P/MRP subunit Pop8-like domain-containing protein n=2 Tax=Trichophyton TaxID=5550 RepID=A0A022W3M7_TRIRU|nr:hypothetical protein H100_04308 [Trichophyton rubrum MR850]EZF42047.1 hypothetical protein H102_04292 [Trichophyton rubrum CBS 100081]EZF52658.1 hypothetical protein H103_04301 [Trichophyton rubrum CBS 288.86]EZF63253.1 hypothetical protein H104_04290 [Trichophyton rubrum CBS 289.86]EZF73986.1 hypothetical protein H105_04317 [Trichophyton soudanense CBS 452.61]EZF84588.1 hypothetical protein H110_04295 [Trichophyton rubrum MR1448]EZF95271.1 hypothetical protein H113_04335 [Trichophyton rub
MSINQCAAGHEKTMEHNVELIYIDTIRVSASDSIAKASSTSMAPDPLTAKTYLTAALSQYLGLSGTAIPVDILKLGSRLGQPDGKSVWIRVPYEDAAAVTAAMSSWIGADSGSGSSNVAWRVVSRRSHLGALIGGSGKELFIP